MQERTFFINLPLIAVNHIFTAFKTVTMFEM